MRLKLHVCRTYFLILLTFAVAAMTACSSPATPPTPVTIDQTTPESTVRSLYEALERGDMQAVRSLVHPADKDSALFVQRLEAAIQEGARVVISDLTIDVVANDGQIARARVSHGGKVVSASGEVLQEGPTGAFHTLVNKDGRWYFIGLDEPMPPGWGDTPLPDLP